MTEALPRLTDEQLEYIIVHDIGYMSQALVKELASEVLERREAEANLRGHIYVIRGALQMIERLRAVEAKLREIHARRPWVTDMCWCGEVYPCQTIRLLDGES